MSVTVVAQAGTWLLTTRDTVRAMLGITTTDDDGLLDDIIDRASRSIARETRRVFGVETVTETLDGVPLTAAERGRDVPSVQPDLPRTVDLRAPWLPLAALPGASEPDRGERVSERKLVSVVTGTWQRHDLLLEAIENVRQQTYPNVEHVIVSDGPDPDLADLIAREQGTRVPIIFQQLGFWSSGLFRDSISAAPYMVAQLLARGEYQMWLADDERMVVPDHIERLVDLCEQYHADFAYPRVRMWWEGRPELTCEIGCNPPRNGQFTHCLYTRAALDKGMLFRTHVGSGTDWDAVSRTMAAGARWAFEPATTLSHRVDK